MYPFGDFQHPLLPHDVAVLQSIFDTELEARKITPNSEAADTIARKLIALYQTGVKDPLDLHERVKASGTII
ncbi:hypothetical protein CO661_01975 [Sinorhizobium fredii]|uniref:Uncharacterized protein n=1 Tax=Rhizobium fredii TaxID=380 RepID=A0A2A6M6I0_RHIFR|nr:hypothetical protein [Sinorhizobium fredii]PDT50421.1 hypothetical protein CO661_01975 [Sinorhizobium fredii]